MFIADAMSFRSGGGVEASLERWRWLYYDAISWGGPWSQQLPVRSLVGLIPLYASLTLEPQILKKFKSFSKRVKWFTDNRRGITERNIASMSQRGTGERMLLALVDRERLEKILERMLDEGEFWVIMVFDPYLSTIRKIPTPWKSMARSLLLTMFLAILTLVFWW